MTLLLIVHFLWFPVKPAERPQPKKAALYSLLYPGLGEYYSGQKRKALAISTIATFFLVKSAVHYWNYRVYRDDYLENGFYSSKIEYENQFRSFMSSVFWYLGVLGFSMVDSYISAHLAGFENENTAIENQFHTE